MTPTPEQEAILSAARDFKESLMITAMAGTGKTSTLCMLAQALPMQPAIALAFNVTIKKELERRVPPFWKVVTLNGLGHRAWMNALRGKRVELDERKLGRLVTAVFKDFTYEGDEDAWGNIRQLVSKAMQAGIVPASRPHKGFTPDTPEQWAMLADASWMQGIGETEIALAREVLTRSVNEGFEGKISFDDQIYLPVCFNGQFPRYPLLMGDEVQDWSVMNRIMVQRTCSGRFILVGDPAQAIYQFRGADAGSMQRLRALRPQWIDLPLSVTFRCPKVVVDRQQKHVPGFQAFHTNAVGEVVQFKRYPNTRPEEKDFEHFGDFSRALKEWKERGGLLEAPVSQTWDWKKVERAGGLGTIAVLSRNNAPLLKIAFKLFRANVPVTMLGRDIGKTLVALSKKVLPNDDMSAPDCVITVNQWKDNQVALANANWQEDKVANVHDQAECLLAVIEGAQAENAAAIRWYLKELFERSSGHVTISTIHRAKGLEWDCILHLDPWRIPSKHAQHNPTAMVQEMNLKYVCETRCKKVLIEANLEDFE
jgi:superfamily I DNA/RNA helicase